MAARSLSLQDHFLNSVRRAKLPVTIFLVKGVKLQGVVTWFDAFSLLLRREGASQLVYKHSISTIMPAEPPPDFVATPAVGRRGQGRAPGPVPRRGGARQRAHDPVPGQRRHAPGRGHRLRPVQPGARARRADPAGLQARDLDAAAGALRSISSAEQRADEAEDEP